MSQCGGNRHNSCRGDNSLSTDGSDDGGEIKLFGVRLRKTVGMNSNKKVSDPVDVHAEAGGNVLTNDVVDVHTEAGGNVLTNNRHTGEPARKRGNPWTEEEHRLFLSGLETLGKGKWGSISRKFVKTRTPSQVASHAQKYFLRKNTVNIQRRRRRRSSLFDISNDSDLQVTGGGDALDNEGKGGSAHGAVEPTAPMLPPPLPPLDDQEIANGLMNGSTAVMPIQVRVASSFQLPIFARYPLTTRTTTPRSYLQANYQMPKPPATLFYSMPYNIANVVNSSSTANAPHMHGLSNVESSGSLSLRLSLASNLQGQSASFMRRSTFRATLKDGDSIISVS